MNDIENIPSGTLKQKTLFEIITRLAWYASRIRFSGNVQSLVLDIHVSETLNVSFLAQRNSINRKSHHERNFSDDRRWSLADSQSLITFCPDESNDNGRRNQSECQTSKRGEMYNYIHKCHVCFLQTLETDNFALRFEWIIASLLSGRLMKFHFLVSTNL